MKLKPGATYQIKQKNKQTGEISKRGKDVNYSHKFIFDGLSRNKRIAHFIHEKMWLQRKFFSACPGMWNNQRKGD